MKIEIVSPQRLLDHQQIEAVETLKTVAVGQGVGGISVTAQQNTRPARADLLQHFDVPARLHLDLNALVSGGQLGFNLLQQLLVRILDTDAHATAEPVPRIPTLASCRAAREPDSAYLHPTRPRRTPRCSMVLLRRHTRPSLPVRQHGRYTTKCGGRRCGQSSSRKNGREGFAIHVE